MEIKYIIKKLQKWFKIKKIKLTNFLYRLIGTRCSPYDIAEDLPDVSEIWREFSILVDIWELTRFKKDTLSLSRLEGCIRAFIKIKEGYWDCPKEKFQEVVEGIFSERIDFYDDSLYTEGGQELKCVLDGADPDLTHTVLLLEYMFKKEIERES